MLKMIKIWQHLLNERHGSTMDSEKDEYQNLYKKQLRKAPETALVWTPISEPFELVCCCSAGHYSLMPRGKQLMSGPN
ncbi:hypothetical protein QYF36_013308 [Acer negundo]|nr:hypothetical protein QYF36_013308 [Acer negundo]